MRTGWLFDLDVSVDGSRSPWDALRKHTHIAGGCLMLACGFALEPEGRQPWADAGGVWAAFLCPHMAVILLQAQGMCGYTPWIHSIGTRLLVGNLLVHSGWGWCTSMTPHQGLGVNYTLESRVSVCAAVGPGKTPSLSHCSCSCGGRCRAVTLYPHPPGFMAWPGSPRCHGVHGRGGLLPTGWVL